MNRVSLAEASVTLSGVLHQATTRLPLTSALQLSLDVVRLVADAHDKGRVIGVLDAAHLICRADGVLSVGGAGGDPIAPELARGDKPDRLSDVYALGALIYRLLTGHKVDPNRFIEPPSHVNPAVDSDLDELVLQALDEDPSERPYSARELEQRMTQIMEDLGLTPGARDEASKLLSKSVAKFQSPVHPQVRVEEPEADDDDDDVPHRPQGFQGFLYDLGWSPGKPQASAFVKTSVQSESDGEERPRHRNRLSQFFYDLGWFQNVDWDSPVTLMWLKRGGIALAALVFLVVVWPSHKKPKVSNAVALAGELAQKRAEREDALTSPPVVTAKIQKKVKTATRH
jgi:serine/threonine protein kinase